MMSGKLASLYYSPKQSSWLNTETVGISIFLIDVEIKYFFVDFSYLERPHFMSV